MKMYRTLAGLAVTAGSLWAGVANAAADTKDLLIQFTDTAAVTNFALMAQTGGAKIESLGAGNWIRVQLTEEQQQSFSLEDIRRNPNVLAAQPNYKLRLLTDYRLKDPTLRAKFLKDVEKATRLGQLPSRNSNLAPADNPEIPNRGAGGSGADPLFKQQWGMNDIGAKNAWNKSRGKDMVVAVIDTGVDYTHEDLVDNLWRNPGEIPANGIDDDGNGFIDDVIGWDFVSNDNKPYDLSMDPLQIIIQGGNPGHGTHCAGNVAARGENGKGIAGVAPDAKIMVLRFLSEKGEGDTASAVKSINYAVQNGAKILSNSWGSEGEDPSEPESNKALRDAIQAAQDAGVLFIAAAGNGHNGVGYNNDTDPKPSVPASYEHENIISVAALDSQNKLGSFSNWGAKSVDIGAPGVVVFSTTVGGKYSDIVIDMFGIKATWDGTSMAAPHVAGAAALYWTAHPNATWREVKEAILGSAKELPALKGKTVSGGKLNVEQLMAR